MKGIIFWALCMVGILGFAACVYAYWISFKERDRD